ncbi:hypothetical protein IW262DRAFT_1451347 [Armillaria fumosa]|nr:hypothetical protein IW262DRAFT_1451347 [Armillaria fumosa]
MTIAHEHADMDINILQGFNLRNLSFSNYHPCQIHLTLSIHPNPDDLEVTEVIGEKVSITKVRTSKHTCKLPASHKVVAAGWLPSTINYLTDLELGEEWHNLLVAWQTLEV